jgi:hypothetical protein
VSVPLYRGMVRGICLAEGWPEPEFEVRVTPTRRWRFDLAWPREKLAIEVNGGVFVAGRHSRGMGQIRDYEKLNAAQLAGWRVLQIVPKQIADGTLSALLRVAFREAA